MPHLVPGVKSLGKIISRRLPRGDTMVEVMISMAVLAIVVGAAYGASTRTFNSSLNSQYRDQAVSYAQQQLELIKEADSTNPSTISSYTTPSVTDGTPFCINPSTKAVQTGSGCVFNKLYTVATTYDSTNKRYQVKTTWPGSSSQTQQTVLFYKPADSFTGTTVACTAPNSSCTSLLTNPPSVQVSAASSSVSPNATDNITWSAINIRAGSCSATGPGTFPGAVDSNASPGTYPFSSPTPGSYTFKISCTDNVGNPVFNSANVTVSNPVPVATTGIANPFTYNTATLNGTVNPKGFATTYVFNYGTSISYGSTTGAASAGAGSSNVAASTGISGLSASTLYHFRICATNAYGTTCGNDNSFTTANNPPPVVNYFYASPGSVGYGGSSTLYWGSTYATSCTYGGPSGSTGTGALYSTTTYGLNCSGPGGSSGTYYATVSVSPPPPPPPPPCSAWASGSNINGSQAYISGGGSSCSYFYDSVVGWNGGGTWGPTGRPVCHTQQGGADPWGWLSSGSWCSG